jgi:hypothetical protein
MLVLYNINQLEKTPKLKIVGLLKDLELIKSTFLGEINEIICYKK